MKALRHIPQVTYNGTDISADLAPWLKSFSVSDPMGGEADTFSFTVRDPDGRWRGAWLPEKGATLVAGIRREDGAGVTEIKLGTFEIDQLTVKGAPSEVSVDAVSVPDNSALRGVEKSKSWEKVKLSEIAKQIATAAGMQLHYDTTEDPKLDRVEQSEQSDLSFLVKTCSDEGLAVKVAENTIIIFNEIDYEKAKSSIAIFGSTDALEKAKAASAAAVAQGQPADARVYISVLNSYQFQQKTRDIYRACHVKYQSGNSGKLIEYTFALKDRAKGKTLEVNEEVDSIAAAEKLAKKRLREKNREELTASFSVPGNFALYATRTVDVVGFGAFDGKYIITKVDHSLGSEYTCSLEIRRCLDGY